MEYSGSSQKGYILLLLMFAVFMISLGLMLAMPVWETQVLREREEELIFRGKQYIEAVRLYQSKNPGQFPRSFDQLMEEKCIRRLYSDPLTEDGRWNVILLTQQPAPAGQRRGASRTPRSQAAAKAAGRSQEQGGASPQKVMIAPQSALSSITSPQIIGVVSTSTRDSIRIYNEQKTYDKWLFFYGQDPKKLPEIVYYGQEEKD
jgi:type II secretory pathway pseudopilin PulG